MKTWNINLIQWNFRLIPCLRISVLWVYIFLRNACLIFLCYHDTPTRKSTEIPLTSISVILLVLLHVMSLIHSALPYSGISPVMGYLGKIVYIELFSYGIVSDTLCIYQIYKPWSIMNIGLSVIPTHSPKYFWKLTACLCQGMRYFRIGNDDMPPQRTTVFSTLFHAIAMRERI